MPNIIRVGGGTVNFKAYLYNSGDECIPLTGGWVTGWTAASPTMTKETDNLLISGTGSAGGAFVTNDAIDLTNINTLYVDWEGTTSGTNGFIDIRVGGAKTDPLNVALLSKNVTFARTIHSLDVSSITGTQYIKFLIASSGTSTRQAKLYKLWLE